MTVLVVVRRDSMPDEVRSGHGPVQDPYPEHRGHGGGVIMHKGRWMSNRTVKVVAGYPCWPRLRPLVLLACLAGLVAPAMAEEPEGVSPACPPAVRQVELACQSWTEIGAGLKAGTRTVIIPVGGTEQSGPYMAVGKHDVRARVLADRIARRVGQTLVAPVLAYVPEGSTRPRTGHMRFAGTLSISPAVFAGLVEGAAESLRAQGFTTIVLLGDHGGYQAQLAALAQRLNRRWAGEGAARVLYVGAYYDVVAGQYADYLRRQGHGVALGKHADISDTSLMLAVDPSLVREGLLRQAGKPDSADGVYGGDPRQATAELGRVGTAMQVQAAVEAISSFNRRHP